MASRWTVQTHGSARTPRFARASIEVLFRAHELRPDTQLARLPYELLFEVFQYLVPPRTPAPVLSGRTVPFDWKRAGESIAGQARLGILCKARGHRLVSLAVQPRTGFVYVSTEGRTVVVYSHDGALVREREVAHAAQAEMFFSADGRLLYAEGLDGIMRTFDATAEGAVMPCIHAYSEPALLRLDVATGRVFSMSDKDLCEHNAVTLALERVHRSVLPVRGCHRMLAHAGFLYCMRYHSPSSTSLLVVPQPRDGRKTGEVVSEVILDGTHCSSLLDGVDHLIIQTHVGVLTEDEHMATHRVDLSSLAVETLSVDWKMYECDAASGSVLLGARGSNVFALVSAE